jgi:hypothetical protein
MVGQASAQSDPVSDRRGLVRRQQSASRPRPLLPVLGDAMRQLRSEFVERKGVAAGSTAMLEALWAGQDCRTHTSVLRPSLLPAECVTAVPVLCASLLPVKNCMLRRGLQQQSSGLLAH